MQRSDIFQFIIKNSVLHAVRSLSIIKFVNLTSVSVQPLTRDTTEEMDYVSNPKLYFE